MTSQEIHDSLRASLGAVLVKNGFEHFGWAPLTPPLSLARYEIWLEQNYHGDMAYLERHLPFKKHPEKWPEKSPDKWLTQAKSAIVVAAPYKPVHRAEALGAKANDIKLKNLKIAAYAQTDDYHFWLRRRLSQVADELKTQFQNDEFMVATDSQPILERDLAYRAGLGWFGKNACLIDQRRGSFFLIGEIITSLHLPEHSTPSHLPAQSSSSVATMLHPDRCGTCNRCIEACPTGAIVEPRVIDARKCISYLTIESKTVPPEELRSQIGSQFFGCDICQDVCPWNQKVLTSTASANETAADISSSDANESIAKELRWILESSSKSLERALAHTPLSRARGFGLKRNAMVVAANLKLAELRDCIASYITDPRLGELATWALREFDC